jgi:hypothetical protein
MIASSGSESDASDCGECLVLWRRVVFSDDFDGLVDTWRLRGEEERCLVEVWRLRGEEERCRVDSRSVECGERRSL